MISVIHWFSVICRCCQYFFFSLSLLVNFTWACIDIFIFLKKEALNVDEFLKALKKDAHIKSGFTVKIAVRFDYLTQKSVLTLS